MSKAFMVIRVMALRMGMARRHGSSRRVMGT